MDLLSPLMTAEHNGMRNLAVPISSLAHPDTVGIVLANTKEPTKPTPTSTGTTRTFSHIDLLSRLDSFPEAHSFSDLRIVALELDLPISHQVCRLLDLHIKVEKKLEAAPDEDIVPFLYSLTTEFKESYSSYINIYSFGIDQIYDSKHVDIRARVDRIILGASLAPSRLGPLDWLFKRPLVRLRYYTRFCKVICQHHNMYAFFRELVHLARDKISSEKEQANDFPDLSTLDLSKTCELVSLAPATPTWKHTLVDKNIKSIVKLRMSMAHVSTGRVLQVHVELVVLEDSILVINRESHRRYLMFSPISGANICVSTPKETANVFELVISGSQRIRFSSDGPVEKWVTDIRKCCQNATRHRETLQADSVQCSTTPKSTSVPRSSPDQPLQHGESLECSSPLRGPPKYSTQRTPSANRNQLAPPSLPQSPIDPPQLPLLDFGRKSCSSDLKKTGLRTPCTSPTYSKKDMPLSCENKQGLRNGSNRGRACQTLCFIIAVTFFWREGDWGRLVDGSTAVSIRYDVGHGVMQIMHIDTGDTLVSANMKPSSTVKREDLTSVSIGRCCSINSFDLVGCDIGTSEEHYLFRTGTQKEADLLLQSLNTAKLIPGPVPPETPTTPWSSRKPSFGSSSSMSSYSTASTNITIPSFVNQNLPPLPPSPVMLSEERVKIFLRIDAGLWKTLGTARLQFHGISDEKASRLVTITGKKQTNKSVTIIDAYLGETACERVGKTGIMLSVMNGCSIVTWMVQGKNDQEAKKLFERIKAGKH